MSKNKKTELTKDDIRKTTRLNKKYILIGIPVILSLLIIGSFFFKIKTPGKVIAGGSWTHYSQLMKPDGSIDYNQEEELIVVCTVEYTTWYGSTYTLRYNRGVRMPYSPKTTAFPTVIAANTRIAVRFLRKTSLKAFMG